MLNSLSFSLSLFLSLSSVLPEGRIAAQDLGMWDDKHVEAFKPLVAAIAAGGTVPGIQVCAMLLSAFAPLMENLWHNHHNMTDMGYSFTEIRCSLSHSASISFLVHVAHTYAWPRFHAAQKYALLA